MIQKARTVMERVNESLAAKDAEIAELRKRLATARVEIERLRTVCGEAYQFAGVAAHLEVIEQPQIALDNLSAAAAGLPLPHETFLPVRIAAAQAERDAAVQDGLRLRKLLWLNHGHTGMYGDDGEMQCAACLQYGVCDFKRAPAFDIEQSFVRRALEAFAIAPPSAQPEDSK